MNVARSQRWIAAMDEPGAVDGAAAAAAGAAAITKARNGKCNLEIYENHWMIFYYIHV